MLINLHVNSTMLFRLRTFIILFYGCQTERKNVGLCTVFAIEYFKSRLLVVSSNFPYLFHGFFYSYSIWKVIGMIYKEFFNLPGKCHDANNKQRKKNTKYDYNRHALKYKNRKNALSNGVCIWWKPEIITTNNNKTTSYHSVNSINVMDVQI